VGSVSQCNECTSEFYGISDKDMPRGPPEEVLDSGGSLKVVEHLGGEDCVEKGTEKTESLRVL
jgi:hypothetical protein